MLREIVEVFDDLLMQWFSFDGADHHLMPHQDGLQNKFRRINSGYYTNYVLIRRIDHRRLFFRGWQLGIIRLQVTCKEVNVLVGVTSEHLVGHTVTFVFRVATQRNSYTKYTGAQLQKLKKGGQYLVFQQWALLRGCAFWEDLKQHGYKQCSKSQICAIKPVKFIVVFACALLIYSIFRQSIDMNSGPHFASL